MNPRPFHYWPVFLVSLNLVALFFVGLYFWHQTSPSLPAEELKVLRLVHHQILSEHVKEHDSGKLIEGAIRAMVRDLDRHSRFISEDEVKAFEADEITGTYEGIGVMMVNNHSPATIRFPLGGGPAEAAGLEAGDRIVAVNGEDIRDVPGDKILETAIKLIKGPAGTSVKLRIERDNTEPFDIDVKRSDVREPAVKWARLVDAEKKIGYIYIADFQQDMVRQFDAAIEDLKAASGGSLSGLILDLRFNPGGLLHEAIALSNRFVEKGPIVVLKRRDGEVVEQHDADPALCTLAGLPVVILINASSASASEVVSGCLQDYGIAKLVGVRSYGKGVVQSIYQWGKLPFRLKLTTSHYYTPKGRSIEARMRREEDGAAEGGLTPDREVEADKRERILVRRTLDSYEVPARHAAAARALAKSLEIPYPEPAPPSADSQLQGAIDELNARIEADESPKAASPKAVSPKSGEQKAVAPKKDGR